MTDRTYVTAFIKNATIEKLKEQQRARQRVEVPEQILDNASIEDLGIDSLGILEIIMAIEDEYSLDIPDEETEGLHIVSDLIDLVMHKLAEKE